jgi:hypothetical protein
MREDRGSLSFEFRNVGSGGRSNLVLFVPHVLRRVCFLVLGFFHDGLWFFLLGANSFRVPFVVTTLCLLPKVELGIGAVLDRPWPSVTMPVFSLKKP